MKLASAQDDAGPMRGSRAALDMDGRSARPHTSLCVLSWADACVCWYMGLADRILVRAAHFFFPFCFVSAFAAAGIPVGIFVEALAISLRTGRPRWAIRSMARSMGMRTVPAFWSM